MIGLSPRLFRCGIILGVSLGGFFDGIVFHQVLQWHHMLSAVDSDITLNTLADGLFHAGTLILALIGFVLLVRARRDFGAMDGGRRFAGAIMVGVGLFNVVEGIVDHFVLRIHHVRTDVADPLPWDVAFLVISAVIGVVGWRLARRRHLF